MSAKGFPTRSLSMISPWDSPLPTVYSRGMVLLPCRFVGCGHLDSTYWAPGVAAPDKLTQNSRRLLLRSRNSFQRNQTHDQPEHAGKAPIVISSFESTFGYCSYRQYPLPPTPGRAGLVWVQQTATGHGPCPKRTPRSSRDRLYTIHPVSRCSAARETLLLEKYGKRGMPPLSAPSD